MKAWLTRLPAPTLLLSVLNAAMLAVLAFVVLRGTNTVSLLRTPAESHPPPAITFRLPARPGDLTLIKDHALFHASRRFFVPPAAPIQSQAPPRPDYRLNGTLVIPRQPAVAFLTSSGTGAVRKVKAGDDVDGWLVQAVENKRVLFRYGQEVFEIVRTAGASSIVPTVSAVQPSGTSAQLRQEFVTDELRARLVTLKSNAVDSSDASPNATLISTGPLPAIRK